MGAQILARNSLPTAFVGPPRHETVDLSTVVTPQHGAAGVFPPHRCDTTPSYFEYSLQICLPRLRRPVALRAIYLPRLELHVLGTMIRVQMTISRARDEGRLTILQRAETGAIPPGQTTLITSTPRWSMASPRTTPMRWTSHRRLAPPRTGLRQLECLLPGCRRALLWRKPYWTRKGLT